MHNRAAFNLFLFVVLTVAQLAAQTPSPSMPRGGTGSEPVSNITAQVAAPLQVSFGAQSATWTPEALAALPPSTVTVNNENSKASETYSGVPLIDLLTRLGIKEKPGKKDLLLYVVATGSDGYAVVYSIGEIMPFIHDAAVIVADSQDGKPLAATGPFELIASREKHPARWVRNLASIKVLSAQ
jgi:hypothetical protein